MGLPQSVHVAALALLVLVGVRVQSYVVLDHEPPPEPAGAGGASPVERLKGAV